jgi:Carbamoyl-phosphate synthase L chain, ATP binding domain
MRLREAPTAILRAAGYAGAATCEFLLGRDGTLAFIEANARLAVAHPVSEEVAGLDLARETFRIAEGEALGHGDPPARGHAIQFRILVEASEPGKTVIADQPGGSRGLQKVGIAGKGTGRPGSQPGPRLGEVPVRDGLDADDGQFVSARIAWIASCVLAPLATTSSTTTARPRPTGRPSTPGLPGPRGRARSRRRWWAPVTFTSSTTIRCAPRGAGLGPGGPCDPGGNRAERTAGPDRNPPPVRRAPRPGSGDRPRPAAGHQRA